MYIVCDFFNDNGFFPTKQTRFLVMNVKQMWHILQCLTMQNRSCNYVLCHQRMPHTHFMCHQCCYVRWWLVHYVSYILSFIFVWITFNAKVHDIFVILSCVVCHCHIWYCIWCVSKMFIMGFYVFVVHCL